MDFAALPGGAEHHCADRFAQPEVCVGDHQLGAGEATSAQPAQERDPERAVFGVADLDAEDFTVAAASYAGGHYHRPGHDPPAGSGLDIGGVQEHVWELDMVEGPVPERAQAFVELPADAADFALGDPRRRAEGPDQVVDFAGTHAVHVGLHHHREQRPVDPTPPLENRGEEAPVTQLRDCQLHIAGLRRQQLRSGAVALVRAALRALMGTGTDRPGRFRVDERLEHHLHTRTDQIDIATGADRVEQLGQVKLGKRHRVISFCMIFGRITQRFTRWPTSPVDLQELHHSEGHGPLVAKISAVDGGGYQRDPLLNLLDFGGCAARDQLLITRLDSPWATGAGERPAQRDLDRRVEKGRVATTRIPTALIATHAVVTFRPRMFESTLARSPWRHLAAR
jgi:hypothetical protein